MTAPEQRAALALAPAQAPPHSRVPRVLVRSAEGAECRLLGALHAEGFGVLLLPGLVTRQDLDGVDLVLLDEGHEEAFAELITLRRSPVPEQEARHLQDPIRDARALSSGISRSSPLHANAALVS